MRDAGLFDVAKLLRRRNRSSRRLFGLIHSAELILGSGQKDQRLRGLAEEFALFIIRNGTLNELDGFFRTIGLDARGSERQQCAHFDTLGFGLTGELQTLKEVFVGQAGLSADKIYISEVEEPDRGGVFHLTVDGFLDSLLRNLLAARCLAQIYVSRAERQLKAHFVMSVPGIARNCHPFFECRDRFGAAIRAG